METLDLKTAIVLFVKNKSFQIVGFKTDKPESLKWRRDSKDSHNILSSSINNGEICINDHDSFYEKARIELFLLSYIIGFPKTYRKIIIKYLFLYKDFWSEVTYITAFNSLNSVIKIKYNDKYDYQKSN